MNCCALIPCRNEAVTIEKLVREVLTQVPRVVVVDDGSTDQTAPLAAAAGATVLRMQKPTGKGAALRTGLNWCWKQGFSHALIMDGDGQHLPADIPGLLSRWGQSGSDLIIGNRMIRPTAMPWLRRQTNRLMSAVLSAMNHQTWPDTQCGFRLLRLENSLNGLLRSQRFEIESEMLVAARAVGWQIEFVPVTCVYQAGATHIRPISDTLNWLRWLWRSQESVRQSTNTVPDRIPSFEAVPGIQ